MFPKAKAANIAIETVSTFKEKDKLEKVIFICFDDENFKIYNELI
jgi:O-acetyl-ADP-ribose deacetylase (regulator of RNase III)